MAVTAAKINTGRRKEAVARVRLVPAKGNFSVNGRTLDDYFPTRVHRMVAVSPFRLVGREKDFDVITTIRGGGISGQAGAIRLGIAEGPHRARPRAASPIEGRGLSHPRRPREGTSQVRPEEGPQGPAVLEALIS